MKKTLIFIALFVVLIVTMSWRSDRTYQAALNFDAPALELKGISDSSVLNLDSFKGQYVVINFWSSTDAESRIAAHDYDRFVAGSGKQLRLLQVNLDQNKRLFREIVRRDGLNAAQQFIVDTPQIATVTKAFNLESGLQSYLVDPDGRIVAVNPTINTIAKALAS